jgi:hypothetical protein
VVADIRTERLQDITPEEAIAEGIERSPVRDALWHNYGGTRGACAHGCLSPRVSYANLWESIYGPASWDSDPWVWVIEFKRVTP